MAMSVQLSRDSRKGERDMTMSLQIGVSENTTLFIPNLIFVQIQTGHSELTRWP